MAYTEDSLRAAIEALARSPERTPAAIELLAQVRQGLSKGVLRVASPVAESDRVDGMPAWRVNEWVKTAMLLMSRLGVLTGTQVPGGGLAQTELDTTPWLKFVPQNCRVPAGTLIREGAYLAEGVTCLPPSVIQMGCYVGRGTIIDSMVTLGLGAQIGAGVQLSCGSIVGGAILPLPSLPTIVEDGVLMGSASGVYDGVLLGRNSVLLAGTQITPSIGLYDLEQGRAVPLVDGTLQVPENSIVGMGTRPLAGGLQLQTAMIVGRRRGSTAASWEMFIDMPNLVRGSSPIYPSGRNSST